MADTVPRTQEPTTVGGRNIAILALVSVVQLMVIIDASIVNVALPSIKNALHFSQVDLQWVINAYTLLFAGLLLLVGRAAIRLARTHVLMARLALLTATSPH